MMKYLIYTLVFLFALNFTSCERRVFVAQPATIRVVKKSPIQLKIVRVKGKRFYFFSGKYYAKTRRGYVVVGV